MQHLHFDDSDYDKIYDKLDNKNVGYLEENEVAFYLNVMGL